MKNFISRYKYGLILLLLITLWLFPKQKHTVFYALEDLVLDWYSLVLFSDNTFQLHIPVVDYSGKYILKGDTILLTHDSPNATAHKVPAAFLISKEHNRITELEFVDGKYVSVKGMNRSMNIVKNKF